MDGDRWGREDRRKEPRPRSGLWYALPLLFGIIGGAIAFFVIRKDDPQKAKNCLYLGLVVLGLTMLANVFLLAEYEGVSPGFGVNV